MSTLPHRTSTITPRGSDEVLAPLGSSGTFYPTKWQDVRVIRVGVDEDVPLRVRESLVGLVVPTIFTAKRLRQHSSGRIDLPEGMRTAYVPDVASVLEAGRGREVADELRAVSKSPLDLYTLASEDYELV